MAIPKATTIIKVRRMDTQQEDQQNIITIIISKPKASNSTSTTILDTTIAMIMDTDTATAIIKGIPTIIMLTTADMATTSMTTTPTIMHMDTDMRTLTDTLTDTDTTIMVTAMTTTTIITTIIIIPSASAIIGLSYMLLFDAFGILNIFVSSVIHTDIKMKKSTVKHPFGVQRFEILFGLFNAIFLLFIGMNMLKESLEHLMLEDDHHGGDHGAVVRVPVFWTLVALGATLVSSLGYQNHKQFCLLLNANGHVSTQAAFGRSDSSKLVSLASNKFTLTSLACVVGVLLVAMFPKFDALDKMIAIGQSIVMFSLGGPLAKVLGMLLLQTTPPRAMETIEDTVRQLSAVNPAILRMERAHVWTNTFGQLIGTVVISVAKGADEQAILASIHQSLAGFLDLDAQSEGTGELTVQLIQN
ncbi:Endoplasmic reticulum zinc transporter [Linnemannia elongata]|nr:Endoplasmic reticulum zinc transporter [Linnemannia elongata]